MYKLSLFPLGIKFRYHQETTKFYLDHAIVSVKPLIYINDSPVVIVVNRPLPSSVSTFYFMKIESIN